ncbi:MAG: hypothetical protein WHX52_22350, partial [Anaerolineae bacterium]
MPTSTIAGRMIRATNLDSTVSTLYCCRMSEWGGASQRCEQRQQSRTHAGRLTALTHTHNGALLARYAYTLDA